jgi:hypothetical protein
MCPSTISAASEGWASAWCVFVAFTFRSVWGYYSAHTRMSLQKAKNVVLFLLLCFTVHAAPAHALTLTETKTEDTNKYGTRKATVGKSRHIEKVKPNRENHAISGKLIFQFDS